MDNGYYSRQTFLGADAPRIFEHVCVGIVGLGGGGSHIAQQLAHVGFKNYRTYDFDRIEAGNMNRTVGATARDVSNCTPKVYVAERTIRRVRPDAAIESYRARWQDETASLSQCHLVFGCLDGFLEREQLERFCRRYLIAYIDIGMGVNRRSDGPGHLMGGQAILSLPGSPCMRCMDFITVEMLQQEAAQYGDAGPRPQVIWPNGILASSAVGMAVNLLTRWSDKMPLYLQFDGNAGTLKELRKGDLYTPCRHYPSTEIGDVVSRAI